MTAFRVDEWPSRPSRWPHWSGPASQENRHDHTYHTDAARHYETLSPDAQLFWRLQARRDTNHAVPHRTGESYALWADRLDAMNDDSWDIYLALDVMMLGLLDPPATLQPGLCRTAWAILLKTEPFESLGSDDATRLEALAQQDTGPLIDPVTFRDAAMGASLAEEERLSSIFHIPGQTDIIAHPAASSMAYLAYAARQGLTLEGASPELHAAILRLLATNDTLVKHTQDENTVPAQVNAAFCVTLIIRLLYLPQLLPAKLDMNANLTYCAMAWRMARDLWSGTPEWKADLNLLRTHLKTLGRIHDNHRQMRCLEPYGPAVHLSRCQEILTAGMELHEHMLHSAHLDLPDIDPVVLDLPQTSAGRFAARLTYVMQSCAAPTGPPKSGG